MAEAAAVDQAKPQSMEDRIAAQFGIADDQAPDPSQYDGQPYGANEAEESAEEAPEEAAEATPEEVEIEYDGQKFRIPKALEKGVMQERDYTQKSQSLADQRRQVEYTQQALEAARLEREFHESIKDDVQNLALMDNYLQQMKGRDVRELPLDELIKHKFGIDALKEQRDALDKSIEGRKSEYTKKAKDAVQSLKAQAREILAKQISGLNDATLAELVAYAKAQGYSEQDAEMIQLDPRALTMAHKAAAWDRLQAEKAEAVSKAKAAPPTVKPGSANPMPQTVKDKFAYNKALKSAKTAAERNAVVAKRIEAMNW